LISLFSDYCDKVREQRVYAAVPNLLDFGNNKLSGFIIEKLVKDLGSLELANKAFAELTVPESESEFKKQQKDIAEISRLAEKRGIKSIEVKIPPGVDTGTRLRLTGEGEAGAEGGPRGDLFVSLVVGEHKFFISKVENRNRTNF
jgi:hypothetical protein